MNVKELLQASSHLRVLVVGDVMLDRYLTGKIHRKSPEADVPVLLHEHSDEKAGGAANVALNFKAFGCNTHLIGMVGNDADGMKLEKLIHDQGVTPHLIKDPNRPTTVKTRVLNGTLHLLRVDFESNAEIDSDLEKQTIGYFENLMQEQTFDICVFQDYNKGFLTAGLIGQLIPLMKEKGIFISVDPKFNNYWNYIGVDLFKPNLKEARTALGPDGVNTKLEDIANKTQGKLECKHLAITMSEDGIAIRNRDHSMVVTPARAISIVDVCGAGDAVLCSLSLAAFFGWKEGEMGLLGNLTGAQVCTQSGVVVVDPHSLVL